MNSENQGVSDASIEREIQAKGLTAPLRAFTKPWTEGEAS